MPDTPAQETLDPNAFESRLQSLEAAWQTWRPGEPIPRWQEYVPAEGASGTRPELFYLVQLDIECRIRAGLPALLAEGYFAHPRLMQEDARFHPGQQVELIYWEYQQRWKHGRPARREEYEAAFPQHAKAIRQLKPRLQCPRCQKIVPLDETYQTFVCPVCGPSSISPVTAPPFGPQTSPRTIPTTELDLRGYTLSESLGKGGMGEVYRACDPALSRDLAIKVIRADYHNHPVIERRFLREARITGSLQHPSIVAVHNLGRLPDGRLHYTMRLVRGRTFADILKEEAGKPEHLPALLSTFEKICQAAAYAHSKHVIHRDLKPQNVMVGRFGEVQVMDWGLAKLMTADDPPAGTEETAKAGDSHIPLEPSDTPLDRTQGPGFGTPPYMSPEQALGEWHLVDERTDVFALGSILCEMLTTRPAYTGSGRFDVEERAKRGDLAETLQRLEQCSADASLIELCQQCLSPNPEDRPRDADAVVKRVARYQAEVRERLKQVEWERSEAQLKAGEERKRRRLAIVLSSILMIVFVTGAAISALFAVDARKQAGLAKTNAEAADDNAKRAEANEQLAKQTLDKVERTMIEGLIRPFGGETKSSGSLSGVNIGLSGGGFMGATAFSGGRGMVRETVSGFGFGGGVAGIGGLPGIGGSGALGGLAGSSGLGTGLRGMGQSRNLQPADLEAAEVEALSRLHELASDHVRIQFIEEGLRTVEKAPRLDRRAPWVIQAVVGLDANRRRQVTALLMRRLREPNVPDGIKEACVRLGLALGVDDPAFDELVSPIIVAAVVRCLKQNERDKLLERLQAFGDRLDASGAAQVVEAILTTMSQTNDPATFSQLSVALQAGSEKVDAAAAGKAAEALLTLLQRHTDPITLAALLPALRSFSAHLDAAAAGKAAEIVLANLRQTTDPMALYQLCLALQGLGERLDRATTGKAVETLLTAFRKASDPLALQALPWTLQVLSAHLDPAAAGKAAQTLLAILRKTTDPNLLWQLCLMLRAVAARLDATQGTAAAGKAAEVLLASLRQTTDPTAVHIHTLALQALSSHLDAARAGKAVEALLATLGDSTQPWVFFALSGAMLALGGHLDATTAGKAAETVLALLRKSPNAASMQQLCQALVVLCERVEAARGAALAAQATELILANLGNPNDPLVVLAHFQRSAALEALSGHLDAAAAGKAADTLLATLNKTSDPDTLFLSSRMLRAVRRRLDAARVKTATDSAAAILLNAMSRTNEPYYFVKLARELHLLAGHLDPAMARKVFEALPALVDTLYGPALLEEITLALLEWSGRLDEATAAATAQKSARALLTALGRGQSQQLDSGALARALRAVCHRLDTPELVVLMEHPLAAAAAQRVLLDALGQRTRRDFRNPWHFLEWSHANGVNLVSSSPPAGEAP
jgi:serine/threonine protein kinase